MEWLSQSLNSKDSWLQHFFLGPCLSHFHMNINYDLSLVQHFTNFLWYGYVDHIFLGVYEKGPATLYSCKFQKFIFSEAELGS